MRRLNAPIIQKILTNKLNAWISVVAEEDKAVAECIRKNAIVMGGCITSLACGEKPNDYDIYFRTEESVLRVAQFYTGKYVSNLKSANAKSAKSLYVPEIEYIATKDPIGLSVTIKSEGVLDSRGDADTLRIEGVDADVVEAVFGSSISSQATLAEPKKHIPVVERYAPVFITDNAITLTGGIQLVTRFVGEPEYVVQFYDFEHCKMWFDLAKRYFHAPEDPTWAMSSKTLIYTGSKFPICSMFRIRKFLARGWSITAGQELKIAMQIWALDLSDINVFKNQLIGVDTAYFREIIECMEAKHVTGEALDHSYVVELINKFF